MTQKQADKLNYYSTEVIFPYCENEFKITSPNASNYYDHFFTEDHKIGRNVPLYDKSNESLSIYRGIQLLDPSTMLSETIILQSQNPDTMQWEPDTSISIWYDMTTLSDGSFVGILPTKEYPYAANNSRRIICWDSDGKKRFEFSTADDLGIGYDFNINNHY